MKITLASVAVDDQAKALAFYTEKLGFTVKHDIDMGEARWLTVTSPEGHDDVELALEPNLFPPAQVFYKELREAGIPATALTSSDVQAEYEKLVAKGVEFKTPPTEGGGTVMAIFDDTCGNYIQMYQV